MPDHKCPTHGDGAHVHVCGPRDSDDYFYHCPDCGHCDSFYCDYECECCGCNEDEDA